MLNDLLDYLKNKKIAILGMGKEGVSTYKFIRRHLPNQFLTILDQNDLKDEPIYKNDRYIEFVSKDNYLDNLDKYDLIIKTPGISFKNINIERIKDKITSQLELILKFDSRNIIGITGTKGKSTTSSLLYEVLKHNQKDVFILGNIGNPIFDEIENIKEDTLLVIEMSSHQLEFVNYSPHIGVILNLYQDHLDHAGSVENYHQSKLNIFKYQNKDDYAIYASDNEYLIKYMASNVYKAQKYKFQEDKCKDKNTSYIMENYIYLNNEKLYNTNDDRHLLGIHNLKNIMAVLIVAKILNLNMDLTKEAINNFKSLPYRMEDVGKYDGIHYYCDTIATIPEATISALESLNNIKTLIIGGEDRHIDYSKFIEYLKKSEIDNLICMPTTGLMIGKLIDNKKVYFVNTLEEAVVISKKVTPKESGCLLSPAAASYEFYKNFEEKGDEFKKLIKS